MTVLDLEKECPVCGEVGPALGDDGEHTGTWRCKNDECYKDIFVSTRMEFYNTHKTDWTWNDIKVKYT